MIRARPLAAVATAALLLTSFGCGGDDGIEPQTPPATTPSPSVVPAGDASIEITSPDDGDEVKAGDVKIVTEVSGFDLVDKIGEEAAPGEGHIIYYLGSGYEIPVAPDRPATVGGQGAFTSYMSHRTSYTWPNVPPGRQTFTVQLVNNDNRPLDPPQSAQVDLTVE